MVSNGPAIILAAVLCLVAARPVQADCQGRNLFPALKSEAPAAYASIEAAASAMPFGHGKLFRLTGEAGTPSYLFGTLHLTDPRVTEFSTELLTALAGSKTVVLETSEIGAVPHQATVKNPTEMRTALLAQDDRRPDHLLGSGDFVYLETVLERRGLDKSHALKFKASILALLLEVPTCAIRQPGAKPYADELIADIAREKMIPVVGLETMIEQLEILNGLPREADRDLLIATLRLIDHAEDIVETTIAQYQEGDIGGLLAWTRSADPIPGIAGARTPPAFLDRLLTLRNYRMRDRALPLLMQGGAFIAVGAAHLPGKDGLLHLFEEEGYRIEIIE